MNISIETPTKEVCDWLAGLVETAAPELAKLYVVDPAGLPSDFNPRGGWGYTSPMLCWQLRPHLEAVAQWHGPRPAVVVAVGYMADLAAAASRHIGLVDSVEQFKRQAAATALHEAAHCLTHGRPYLAAEPQADSTASGTQELADHFLELSSDDDPRETRLAGALSHDAAFVRAAIHTAARANLDPIDVVGSGQPGNAAEYIRLLGDEPEQLAGMPIRDALKKPAPAAFTEYFESSLRLWWHEQYPAQMGKPFSKDLF